MNAFHMNQHFIVDWIPPNNEQIPVCFEVCSFVSKFADSIESLLKPDQNSFLSNGSLEKIFGSLCDVKDQRNRQEHLKLDNESCFEEFRNRETRKDHIADDSSNRRSELVQKTRSQIDNNTAPIHSSRKRASTEKLSRNESANKWSEVPILDCNNMALSPQPASAPSFYAQDPTLSRKTTASKCAEPSAAPHSSKDNSLQQPAAAPQARTSSAPGPHPSPKISASNWSKPPNPNGKETDHQATAGRPPSVRKPSPELSVSYWMDTPIVNYRNSKELRSQPLPGRLPPFPHPGPASPQSLSLKTRFSSRKYECLDTAGGEEARASRVAAAHHTALRATLAYKQYAVHGRDGYELVSRSEDSDTGWRRMES